MSMENTGEKNLIKTLFGMKNKKRKSAERKKRKNGT
jgi:hypothetical protein